MLDMTLQATRRGIIAARLRRSAASRSLWPAKALASVFDYASENINGIATVSAILRRPERGQSH
jgi:hypothetical protein